MTNEQLADRFKALANLFLDIRMDWSDPRYECRMGISACKNAIKLLTGEDYEPKWEEK